MIFGESVFAEETFAETPSFAVQNVSTDFGISYTILSSITTVSTDFGITYGFDPQIVVDFTIRYNLLDEVFTDFSIEYVTNGRVDAIIKKNKICYNTSSTKTLKIY